MSQARTTDSHASRWDRPIVAAALAGIVVLSWLYLARMHLVPMALQMPEMDAVAMASMPAPSWTAGYFVATLLMWVVMMIGMMVPSAAPTILLFAALQRHRAPDSRRGPYAGIALFLAGYVGAWTAFSLVATLAQWRLSMAGLLTPDLIGTGSLGGALFVAAGLYQLTPLKNACLEHCQSPAGFLVRYWGSGTTAPLLLGARHGVYCLGCCWMLMLLLFAFGVMNLLWVAALGIFVLIEKLAPPKPLFGKISAVMMIAAGGVLLALG